MQIQPYLNFDGHCDEAIAFYKTAVGAKVTMLMRYKENPEPPPPGTMPPGAENKVMHSAVVIGDSTVFMTDGHCKGEKRFSGFMLSLGVSNDAEAKRFFTALSDGGKVTVPLAKTFFSSSFGMIEDRFGVNWMVIVQP